MLSPKIRSGAPHFMSAVSTATTLAAAQAGQTQAALAAVIAKQNHDAQAGLVALIEQAAEAAKQASPTAPGTGTAVDLQV